MSEYLAAASSKTGVPEELLQRAAAARAEASGSETEAVLEAWAAGAAVAAPETPASSSQPPAEPAPAPEAGAADADATAAAEAAATPAAEAAPVADVLPPQPVAAISRESVAPILTGRSDNPWLLVLGAVGVLVLGAVFGVLLPSLDIAEARNDAIPGTTIEYTDIALEGRDIYLQEGCWYCHTQQVRPIVTDADLGRVTTAALVATESSDTLGFQRLGPDLANVAAREPFNDPGTIVAYLRNPEAVVEDSRQPSFAHLGTAELEAVAQYLIESSEPYDPADE